MCQVGVFNVGRSCSMGMRLSKECKGLFNNACAMLCCHVVVHYGVKTTRFWAVYEDHP